MKHQIHQIFYSEQTRAENDPGFLPLDYLSNDRPDWREYWPIRRFLLTNRLDDDTAYGFFSPKFGQKTNLSSADVHRFVTQCDADGDVDAVLFSPFYDQSAFFLNVFEQAGVQHPGIGPVLLEAAALVEPVLQVDRLVMSSTNTVYCNFFVAKPKFWRLWLTRCEQIFVLAEAGDTPLAAALNAPAEHLGGAAPAKVFMIERVASLILSTWPDLHVRVFDPTAMPMAAPALRGYVGELAALDALKIAHGVHPFGAYLTRFSALRQNLLERLQASRNAS